MSEGVGQLHFMNNEKNDVNNAVPLFGSGSRLAEADASGSDAAVTWFESRTFNPLPQQRSR